MYYMLRTRPLVVMRSSQNDLESQLVMKFSNYLLRTLSVGEDWGQMNDEGIGNWFKMKSCSSR